MKKSRLVFGVGINDVGYVVCKKITVVDDKGARSRVTSFYCPYYRRWQDMLRRCYSDTFQRTRISYIGCTVYPEWLHLSKFIKWVDQQSNKSWQNCELDKDILVLGNKLYSPDTCVFVDIEINNFITDNLSKRGEHLIGVCFDKHKRKFKADCRDPFLKKKVHIGYFDTELEAHLAWKAKKHQHACNLADLQEDLRVAKALRERYAPETDWVNLK